MPKYLRIMSAVLALLQLGWAAAIGAAGDGVPKWAIMVGAVVAAIGTAAPGIFKGLEE